MKCFPMRTNAHGTISLDMPASIPAMERAVPDSAAVLAVQISAISGIFLILSLAAVLAGQRRRANPNAPRRGSDVHTNLTIDFFEACKGAKKTIQFNRQETCTECHGSGCEPGTSPTTCPDCHGTGQVTVTQRTPLGQIRTSRACSRCGGRGQTIDHPCRACRGTGRKSVGKKFEINIPAGIDDGQIIQQRGQGNAGSNGGPSGDLYVTVSVRPDSFFHREEFDIYCDIPLTYLQAVAGDEILVPTIDGKVKFTIPAGTQPGTTFRLKGKGLQRFKRHRTGRPVLYRDGGSAAQPQQGTDQCSACI